MDQYITADSLKRIGIKLEGRDVASLLEHLNDTLEERIGAEITDALDDKQLDVLVDMQEKASDDEIGAWLQSNVPDFEDIVQDEIDIVLGELAESTNGINKAA